MPPTCFGTRARGELARFFRWLLRELRSWGEPRQTLRIDAAHRFRMALVTSLFRVVVNRRSVHSSCDRSWSWLLLVTMQPSLTSCLRQPSLRRLHRTLLSSVVYACNSPPKKISSRHYLGASRLSIQNSLLKTPNR